MPSYLSPHLKYVIFRIHVFTCTLLLFNIESLCCFPISQPITSQDSPLETFNCATVMQFHLFLSIGSQIRKPACSRNIPESQTTVSQKRLVEVCTLMIRISALLPITAPFRISAPSDVFLLLTSAALILILLQRCQGMYQRRFIFLDCVRR